MGRFCNKNVLLTAQEQYEENPSPASQEEDQTNSRETSSEIINHINVDDGASKKRFQLLRYDTANCSFPSLNESMNHPKV
jgi:hypothetical protein